MSEYNQGLNSDLERQIDAEILEGVNNMHQRFVMYSGSFGHRGFVESAIKNDPEAKYEVNYGSAEKKGILVQEYLDDIDTVTAAALLEMGLINLDESIEELFANTDRKVQLLNEMKTVLTNLLSQEGRNGKFALIEKLLFRGLRRKGYNQMELIS